ncbi:MAG: hypothetical protein GY774_00380 [Planctomycetes bacterium]|nr:hypothetical protein [Planctomycetota bacterium]
MSEFTDRRKQHPDYKPAVEVEKELPTSAFVPIQEGMFMKSLIKHDNVPIRDKYPDYKSYVEGKLKTRLDLRGEQ